MNGAGPERAPRSALTLTVLGVLAALGIAALLSLGVWQVQRLAWKTDLIERVETRLASPPSPAPTPAEWADVSEANDEYRKVTVTGRFLHDQSVQTQAVTALGAGFWLMTPVQTADGTYLVNRGFVPSDNRDGATLPEGDVTVTGLMRMTEPEGGFLRKNDPAADRWFSRDVAAIGSAKGLTLAPFFIDAEIGQGLPVGGLTVVSFPNKHLGYALTWFALAAGLAGAAIYVALYEKRLRRK